MIDAAVDAIGRSMESGGRLVERVGRLMRDSVRRRRVPSVYVTPFERPATSSERALLADMLRDSSPKEGTFSKVG